VVQPGFWFCVAPASRQTAAGGLPREGVAVLLGIDAVMDMVRTSVNVLGNCLATAVIARWEGLPLEPSGTRQ